MLRRLLLVAWLPAVMALWPDVDPVRAGEGGSAEPRPRIAKRVYPATVAKRRLETPPPPPPSAEELEQQVKYKIAGGKTAVPGQLPWQVALIRAGSSDPFGAFYCGGTLIADRFVLTAAHCTYEEDPAGGDGLEMAPGAIEVLVGTTNFEGGAVHKVVDVVRHAFNHETYDNDIAILELATVPVLGAGVQPIALVAAEAPVYGTNVLGRVSGWGAAIPGPIPVELRKKVTELQYVDVNIKDTKPCNQRYVDDYRSRIYEAEIRRGRSQDQAAAIRDQTAPLSTAMVNGNMFCAGGSRDAAQDSCSGDSGGPFVIRQIDDAGAAVPVQAGIVSWGPSEGCGLIDRFGVYVRLERYRSWIDARLNR